MNLDKLAAIDVTFLSHPGQPEKLLQLFAEGLALWIRKRQREGDAAAIILEDLAGLGAADLRYAEDRVMVSMLGIGAASARTDTALADWLEQVEGRGS